ncbi:TIGR03086 family metal-binding protein [Streptacidiphilus pinicola]|uniref:TIGR03086 family metal-binding protein n=1 Tax=Streptacidiphilus pinicola TaxID=2219663 RepID=UPI0014025FF4|nr:TIGR03086 family metal-binding protein [Streptacidiphilus pinicola]
MNRDAVERLSRVLAQTADLVERVRPEQAPLPTPCRSWDVGRLVNHLLHELEQSRVRAEGGIPDLAGDGPEVAPERWSPLFEQGAKELLAAWRESRATDQDQARFTLAQQTAEFAVHGWDLARATGQPTNALDADAAEASLAWAREALQPQYRGAEEEGHAFGPEVRASEALHLPDRLAAFFGRDPA